MNFKLSKGVSVLLVALSLGACQQRIWQAEAALSQTNVPVDNSLADDLQAETTIAPYRAEVTTKMSEVVGHAPEALVKADYQSPLGNFVVDLQLTHAEPVYGKPIDLSLTTNGGLRVPLPAGEITTGNVFELMPFENELVVLTLSGNTVKQLFDYAAENKNAPIGNATYTVSGGKATDIKINGKPFNPNQSYTLVTSNYLAGGGDGLSMLKDAENYEGLGLLLRDAILQEIRRLTAAGKPITTATTPRVTVLP